MPSDQVSTPSYGPDVASATLALVDRGERGTWHVAGPDLIDRVELARLACLEWGLDPGAVESAPTSALQQKAKRPLAAGLRTDRLRAAGIEMRPVREGLRAMREAIEAGGYASDR